MEMKRTIFVVISCFLLLGLVLAGCGGGGEEEEGVQVGVWPKAEYGALGNNLSRIVVGLNWTNVEYPGTTQFVIPPEYLTAWGVG
jgi:hypothetical protein